MAQTAFVTGANGFIGVNLVQELVNQGWQVTAMHRPTSDTTYLSRFPVDLVEGSITDIESLRSAVPDGTDVIFHVAGDTNFWSKLNDRQTAVNVTGTENMITVAKEKGVACFIHTSSINAWGEVSGHVTEETPKRGMDSKVNYNYTKWAGGQAALQGADDNLKVVVLCPAAVMGPFDVTGWGRIFLITRDGDFPFSPPGAINITHVREVVKAHVAAVEKGRPGATYILAGYECQLRELTGEIARCLGLEPSRTISPFLLRLMGRLSVMGAAITGKPPLMTPEMAANFSRPTMSFASDLAVAELEYELVPMETCVKDAYDWLVAEGLL